MHAVHRLLRLYELAEPQKVAMAIIELRDCSFEAFVCQHVSSHLLCPVREVAVLRGDKRQQTDDATFRTLTARNGDTHECITHYAAHSIEEHRSTRTT